VTAAIFTVLIMSVILISKINIAALGEQAAEMISGIKEGAESNIAAGKARNATVRLVIGVLGIMIGFVSKIAAPVKYAITQAANILRIAAVSVLKETIVV